MVKNHSFKECPKNRCKICGDEGHIGIDCKNKCVRETPWKFDEFLYNVDGFKADGEPCRCDENAVLARRAENKENRRIPYTTHCCHCK